MFSQSATKSSQKCHWHPKKSYASLPWLTIYALLSVLLIIIVERSGSSRTDARLNSLASTMQILRTQMELYKAQHYDAPPAQGQLWNQLLNPTNASGLLATVASPAYPLGPFLQAIPVNPANGQAAVGAAPSPNVGWVYTVKGSSYSLHAVNSAGDGVLSY